MTFLRDSRATYAVFKVCLQFVREKVKTMPLDTPAPLGFILRTIDEIYTKIGQAQRTNREIKLISLRLKPEKVKLTTLMQMPMLPLKCKSYLSRGWISMILFILAPNSAPKIKSWYKQKKVFLLSDNVHRLKKYEMLHSLSLENQKMKKSNQLKRSRKLPLGSFNYLFFFSWFFVY